MKHLLAFGGGAIPATAAFVVVRNKFDLEDEEFLTALSVACAAAGVVSASLAIVLGTSVHRSLLVGVGAIVLVPLLYVTWLLVSIVSFCLIGGETCYA